MKGSALSAAGQSMLSDEEFADSLLLITQRPLSKGDDLSKQRCGVCGTTITPCWRKGPAGPKTLCNRCGVHWYQNKDRWDLIVEELRATRMDDTVEQASAPTRTVIKKKVDPRGAQAHPAVPDSQRCVKSNGRGWRCSQRKVSGYSYCAHHQRNWDGHEKQWRKAFPNLVYPRKSKKAAVVSDGGVAVRKDGTVRKRERKPKHPGGGVALPEKWGRVGRNPAGAATEFGRSSDAHRTQFGRDSDGSSEPDFVDSRLGKVRAKSSSVRRPRGPANEGSGSMMHLVLPSETDEFGGTRPTYMSDDDDSQLYHGTQLSEEPGESLESAKEVRSPNRADLQPKQEPSLRSEVTTLSPPLKPSHPEPPAENQRCVMKEGTGWQCPRPRQAGLRHCQYHTEARRAKAALQNGLAEKRNGSGAGHEETLSGMDILMRLQLKRKRSEEENENRRDGLAGSGLGLTWKTKMRRRPFSSRGGPVADVKQGSDMSQDSPRPKMEIDPPETEWGGRREEEDDAVYLGVEELRRRLEQSRGAITAQQERNELAGRELMRAKEGRLMAEKRLEDAKREAEGWGDAAAVEKLRKAVVEERAVGCVLRPEAHKLADQFQHQALLLAKQDAHLTDLRTSAAELREEVAELTAEKKELQAQLALLQKASACTLCVSGKPAGAALVPCGHLYCGPCTAKLLPRAGGVSALERAPVADAPKTEGPVGGALETTAENGANVIVEREGQVVGSEGSVRTSRCPCCSVEVQGRLVVQKQAPVDEEMDGAVSLLGLLASESSQ